MAAEQINTIVNAYMDAFNRGDLEGVMTFFSDDAVYQPGDGKTHRGKAEIKAAFEPQFNAALGKMFFDESDRFIDAENRKVAIRWVCRHDIKYMKARGFVMALRKLFVSLVVGEKFGWQGIDVLYFDAEGKIKEKYTYGAYGTRPLIQRSLG